MTPATTTILFTDIVGSTELLQTAGDERAHRDVRDHHRRLIEAIAADDGEHVKWEGDGVMAAFSSATDAVRCAIRMQQSATGTAIRLRVGINVGEALRSQDEDYFGSAVVAAARLCSRAQPGQILCSALVVGLLSGRPSFKFHEIGSMSLKGIEAPVVAHELLYEQTSPPKEWTERESESYRQLAAIAVPDRVEQMATILGLLPFDRTDPFRVVELGCGEGALSYGALDLFPQCSVTALDISDSMRVRATSCLAPFGPRATVKAFDLASADWLPELESADVVLCTLTLHHLADGAKQRVFADIFARLTDRGVFLVADIVEAQHPHQRALLGDLYDLIARRQSLEAGGSLVLYNKFSDDKWNFYRHGLQPQEDPAPLFDQLSWLDATGFEVVDCFWLRAGFGVYGGYKKRESAPAGLRVAFDDAVHSAQLGLKVVSRH